MDFGETYRRCNHCGRPFPLNPRLKNQCFCDSKECQRARKADWQRKKMADDADYRARQRESQKKWREDHPEYQRRYRERTPEYSERNRLRQKLRDARRRANDLVKMDASKPVNPLQIGEYYLIPSLVKMDACPWKVVLIPVCYRG
jgi:hypothetical protein